VSSDKDEDYLRWRYQFSSRPEEIKFRQKLREKNRFRDFLGGLNKILAGADGIAGLTPPYLETLIHLELNAHPSCRLVNDARVSLNRRV